MKEKRKFKVGDKVVVIRPSRLLGTYADSYVGMNGIVVDFPVRNYRVRFLDGPTLYLEEDDLDYAKDEDLMNEFMSLL